MTQNNNTNPFVLITGSTGFVCRFFVEKLLKSTDFNIVLTYRKDKGNYVENDRLFFEKVDLLKPHLFNDVFAKYKPQYVVHLAAMARVKDGEQYPAKVINANVVASIALAKLAEKHGVKSFVFASSNLAQDAVSVVGIGKLLVEQYFQKLNTKNTKFICLRMPNVIDSNGAVTLIFRRLISENKSITITHPDMSRLFITGEKSADWLYYLMFSGKNKSVCVSYEKPLRIVDLATNMISESGKDLSIKIIGMKPGEKLTEKQFLLDEIDSTEIQGLGMIKNYNYNSDLAKNAIEMLNDKAGYEFVSGLGFFRTVS